jgi:2-polyprenyl-6-hydroxyphenyl methylase/3-demethylubiquinone-9 3-methyltransferase
VNQTSSKNTNVNDSDEIAKFNALSQQWWDPDGPLKTLHDINPLRINYIAERTPLKGLRVLDIGCGGGLLSEGMAQCGANVVGIDLAKSSLDVAKEHASKTGLTIDYQSIIH